MTTHLSSRCSLMNKDFKLILDKANELGVPMPATAIAHQINAARYGGQRRRGFLERHQRNGTPGAGPRKFSAADPAIETETSGGAMTRLRQSTAEGFNHDVALYDWRLRRPLSVAVMALLMLVMGVLSFTLMNVDIFPAINLPVVMVVWSYPGLNAVDMERRLVIISERAYSTTVDGIEHIESQSILGIGVLKVYFQPGTDIGAAIAQIDSVSETILRQAPAGTTAPNIISYNAANVPVAQLNIYSDTLSQQQLFDYGLNFIRLQLFTIPGFSSPAPIGGVQRAVVVNLDPKQMYANGLSPVDIGNALSTTNVVIPSGTARMGNYEYDVDLNMNPTKVSEFNQSADKGDQRHPGLSRRRCTGERYASAAKQRRAHRRASRDVPAGDQARGRIDAVSRRCGARAHPGDPRGRAQGPEGSAHLRSVRVRSRVAVGGRARGGDRGGTGGVDGADIHRIVRQHADRDRVDPALDPHRPSHVCISPARRSTR